MFFLDIDSMTSLTCLPYNCAYNICSLLDHQIKSAHPNDHRSKKCHADTTNCLRTRTEV